MPRQNRVTPESEIVADPARGSLMGNRGRLHRPDGTLGSARWTTRAWIACALAFKERRRTIMAPGSYTELFFLDEATAYAAGHRPCAECRREAYRAFRDLWAEVHGPATAPGIDAALHAARTRVDRTKVTFDALTGTLPSGTMIRTGEGPMLIRNGLALPWSHSGYGEARALPAGSCTVLTPAPVVALLRAGLRPEAHPSASIAPDASRR